MSTASRAGRLRRSRCRRRSPMPMLRRDKQTSSLDRNGSPWRRRGLVAGVAFVGAVVLVLSSCKREERDFRVQPPAAGSADLPAVTSFHAGPTTEPSHFVNGYDENAYAMQQGKLYYEN